MPFRIRLATCGDASLVPTSRATPPLREPAALSPRSTGFSSLYAWTSGIFTTPGLSGRLASGSGLRGEYFAHIGPVTRMPPTDIVLVPVAMLLKLPLRRMGE